MRLKRTMVACLLLALGACSTYREHLNRGQRLYEEHEFERALAIWRDLEHDTDSLSLQDRARYAYLRGMTDYRLGFRPDARHWLALAKAREQEHPGGLREAWVTRLEDALTDLNRDVYGGSEALTRSESTAVEHDQASDGGVSSAPVAPAPSEAPPPAPGASPPADDVSPSL